MSKKVKVLVSALVAILLLAVGGAAMVMAQEEPAPPPEAEEHPLLTKVAGILGIEPEVLVAAFEQAQQEMRQEAFNRSLDKAVEKGRITQEEAGAIGEWQAQKPEVLDRMGPRALGFPGLRGGHKWGGNSGWCHPRLPAPSD